MKKLLVSLTIFSLLLFVGCTEIIDSLFVEEPVTSERMNGVWEITAVYDNNDTSVNMLDTIILGYGDINVPMYLNLNNSYDEMETTAGPLLLYLVYGRNNWTTFFGKLDQIFDYVDGRYFTSGEWGIADTVDAENLTIKAKVMPPSMTTFTEILDLIPGINTSVLKKYVIHQFKKVTVEMESDSLMTWEFSDNTEAFYYTQNDELDPELWSGWSASSFSRCTIVMEKRIKTLDQLIDDLSGN